MLDVSDRSAFHGFAVDTGAPPGGIEGARSSGHARPEMTQDEGAAAMRAPAPAVDGAIGTCAVGTGAVESDALGTGALGTGGYPFCAIVGQEELKLALMICAVAPAVGGVLAMGDRGSGKSTTIRALAALLPPAPDNEAAAGIPAVVDLPLGATEDSVVGSLDLEQALSTGRRVFQPGLLARADRGFLYVDEVNLLEDHLVDLLLDAAASGVNVVERDGLSVRHPARFVLVGSGNPEEGELRPQLLDRFGLSVEVRAPATLDARVEVLRRRDAFDRDPAAFHARWRARQQALARRLAAARTTAAAVATPRRALEQAAELCMALRCEGVRGELTLIRAARAAAALEGRAAVARTHLRKVAAMALRHRIGRSVAEGADADARIARAVEQVFGPPTSGPPVVEPPVVEPQVFQPRVARQ